LLLLLSEALPLLMRGFFLEELILFFKNMFRKKEKTEIDMGKLPDHIAIIMDGNGRWAERRGLARSIGHREGSIMLKKIATFCDEIGIKYLTVYAFSTENWKRPKKEVDSLMSLLLNYLRNAEKELGGRSMRIRVIGDIKGLPDEVQKEIKRVTNLTEKNTGLVLNIALNYGSRPEIVSAFREIARDIREGKINIEEINEKIVSEKLYTSGIPDPDLVIRSGGEKRISNFLLWQSAYAEFLFSDDLWPDFSQDHIIKAIRDYQNRDRRYGGI
jgi:undecaprenyl diphosphate synthase